MDKSRQLSNWAESFLEYTSILPSPEIFRRWTAYVTIAGALDRRVWTEIQGLEMYPNLFVVLTGPPAAGKSVAVSEAKRLWVGTKLFNVAPSGMTKAAFIDQMIEKTHSFVVDGHTRMCNTMLVPAPEFSHLMPDYDAKFTSVVNDAYDCNPTLEDRTRGGKQLIIVNRPCISILAGTTPQFLGNLFPDRAYGEGFVSRIIMIYSALRVKKKMFKKAKRDKVLGAKLLSDLILIGSPEMTGAFKWVTEAEDAVEYWNENLEEDAPRHPRLQNYNKRRIAHVVKLSMSMSVSRNNKLIVTMEDYSGAKKMMEEAEHLMPEIFKEMASSEDASELKEIHQYMFSYCRNKEVEMIPEHSLIHFMSERIPVNRIPYFIQIMIQTNSMKVEKPKASGPRFFRPLSGTVYDE